VCGDFNGPPQVAGSKLLESKLTDAFEQAGNGYGYTTPTKAPLVRTDRIFLSKNLTTQTIWSPAVDTPKSTPASTHAPVEVDVTMPR
jgi:endonuclease/exonuclease/phosphatase family metal-dependent hydrolase